MKKSTLALLVAAFTFGFSTADVDARSHHHHRNWNYGKHYHHPHRHHHKRHHHNRHHIAAPPIVVAHIYIGSQHMSVAVNGERYGDWVVSTGKSGFRTPQGSFRATRLERVYYSKKYDNSPMPYSVFFHGGNAIHGTYHIRALGHPASHGCMRLLPLHAAELYALVERYGMARTRIVVRQ